MLVLLAISLIALSGLLLILRPFYGFLLIIISKPIVDMTWEFRPGGYSLVQLLSVLLPLLLLPRLVQSRFWNNPRNRLWILMGGIIFVGQFLPAIVILLQNTVTGIDAIFRSLNVFLAFLMIPAFATDNERLRKILVAFILAGIAPLLVSLYGDITGTVWSSRTTVGLNRNIGLYHNAVSIRHFGLQSILVAMMYLSLFPPRKLVTKLLLVGYMVLSLYMLYKGYTRGGMVTVMAWAIIWAIIYRKLHWGLIMAGVAVVAEFATGGRISEEVMQLFNKEVSFFQGGLTDTSRIMNGRIGVWEESFRTFKEQSLVYQIFGGYHSGLGTHNEFMRALLGTGIAGLVCYLIGVLTISLWSIRHFFRRRTSRYGIFCIMILAMYFVEVLGSTPGAFPQYQWFVFGFLGAFILNSHRYMSAPIRRSTRRRYAPIYRPVREL